MTQIDSRRAGSNRPAGRGPVSPPRPAGSAQTRSRLAERTEVLDKVGALASLPDGVNASTDQVAAFYEVPVESLMRLMRLMRLKRSELRSNGLVVLWGDELRAYKERFKNDLPEQVLAAKQVTLWTRRAVLCVGQLLTGSDVAERVRRYLLAAEAAGRAGEVVDLAEVVRFRERTDYRQVLHSLKLGGAVSDDYRLVQNTLYAGLFGMTAGVIRATREQVAGERRQDGAFTAASARVAKNYLDRNELRVLDSAVATVNAQLDVRYPHGATIEQMLEVVHRAVALFNRPALRSAA